MIATHKELDRLEREGKPHTRTSKDLDQMWMQQIKEAQDRFEKKQKEKEKKKSREEKDEQIYQEKLNSTLSVEEQIQKDREEMMNNMVWNKSEEENND